MSCTISTCIILQPHTVSVRNLSCLSGLCNVSTCFLRLSCTRILFPYSSIFLHIFFLPTEASVPQLKNNWSLLSSRCTFYNFLKTFIFIMESLTMVGHQFVFSFVFHAFSLGSLPIHAVELFLYLYVWKCRDLVLSRKDDIPEPNWFVPYKVKLFNGGSPICFQYSFDASSTGSSVINTVELNLVLLCMRMSWSRFITKRRHSNTKYVWSVWC